MPRKTAVRAPLIRPGGVGSTHCQPHNRYLATKSALQRGRAGTSRYSHLSSQCQDKALDAFMRDQRKRVKNTLKAVEARIHKVTQASLLQGMEADEQVHRFTGTGFDSGEAERGRGEDD